MQKTVVKFVQQPDGGWKSVRVPTGEAPGPKAKAAAKPAAKAAKEAAAHGFVLDQYVWCRDKGGKWFNGTVTCLSPLEVQADGGVKGFAWDEVVAVESELEDAPVEKPKKKKQKAASWGEDEGWAEGDWDEWAWEDAPKKKKKKKDKHAEWAGEDWAEPSEPPAKKAKKLITKVRVSSDLPLVYGNSGNAEIDEEPSSPKKTSASGGKGFLGAKGGGKGVNPKQSYSGTVRLRDPLTGDLLVHCEPVMQAFKMPASIPYGDNPGGARVGSMIVFKVDVSDEGKPLAVDVCINGFDDEVEGAEPLPDSEEDEEEEDERAPKGKKGKGKGGKDHAKGGAAGKGAKGYSKGWDKGKSSSKGAGSKPSRSRDDWHEW